ncbi:MAG: sigma-70 family RNA polymerase sigma factor [Verrucomicrobiota bacterium]
MEDSNERAAFFEAHRPALVRYAGSFLSDSSVAEDVVQEAWLRFDRSVQGRVPQEPISFLYRIVRNLAIDAGRRSRREQVVIASSLNKLLEEAAEPEARPEADLVARDDLKLLKKLLEELPEPTRTALRMKRLGNKTLREIATELGLSITSTHRLIVDGIEFCRERIWPDGDK